MRLGLSLGIGGAGAAWSPALIASKIYESWDAETAASLTLSGTDVTAWASSKGLSATGAATAYPQYSATSFNSRPGLTFDGTNDCLTATGIGAIPSGSSAFELWALAKQDAADASARHIAAWGAGTAATCMRLQRTATNVAGATVGNGTTGVSVIDSDPVFSGIHVVRVQVSATAVTIATDGTATGTGSVVPAIGTTRLRIGASELGTASLFWQGVINYIAVTQPLSAGDAASMLAFLKARGGVA